MSHSWSLDLKPRCPNGWPFEMKKNTGRPVGTAEFVTGLERILGRRIARRASGPMPAAKANEKQLKLLQ